MITKEVIQKAITKLSEKRKLFWSEADFQFSLALVLRDIIPNDAQIYLERPIAEILSEQQVYNKTNNRKTFYIDILIQVGNTIYPIELKYSTKEQEITDYDERKIRTVEQAAYDITRFGYLYDIHRIEQIRSHISKCKELKFGRGFAIILTNDSNYYAQPSRMFENTRDASFRIHEGNIIQEVKWNYNNPTDDRHWTKTKHPYNQAPFVLPLNFRILWEDFVKESETKYLLNTVEP